MDLTHPPVRWDRRRWKLTIEKSDSDLHWSLQLRTWDSQWYMSSTQRQADKIISCLSERVQITWSLNISMTFYNTDAKIIINCLSIKKSSRTNTIEVLMQIFFSKKLIKFHRLTIKIAKNKGLCKTKYNYNGCISSTQIGLQPGEYSFLPLSHDRPNYKFWKENYLWIHFFC